MKRRFYPFAILPLLLLLIGSCSMLTGEEIGRLAFQEAIDPSGEIPMKEVVLELQAGDDIGVWSEMDMEYDGHTGLAFILVVTKGDETVASLQIDPTQKNISIMETKTDINGSVDWSFTGKNTEVEIKEAGTYSFRAALISNGNPTLKLTQADIIFKI